MNELYGLDPDELNLTASELKFILNHFGLTEGRFIGQYPKSWVHDILGSIPRQSKQFSDLVTVLQASANCFLPVSAHFNLNRPWSENAARVQKTDRTFERLFSRAPIDFIEPLERIADPLQCDLKDGREEFIEVTPAAYARSCLPLFFFSEEVVIHDYFMTLRRSDNLEIDRSRSTVLEHLFRSMVDSKRTKRVLLVFNHAQISRRMEETLSDDLSMIAERANADSNLEILWEVEDLSLPGGSHHPRCIFSVKGGLQFDQGFQIFKTAERNLVRWMSPSTLRPFQMKYLRYFHS